MRPDGQVEGKEESANRAELKARARRVASSFLVPPSEDQLFASLADAITRIGQPYDEIGRVLRANIEGLIAAVSIPFALAYRSTHDRHWQRIYSAARIRSLKLLAEPSESPEALDERRERDALEHAKPGMHEFAHSTEGKDAITQDILTFLERLEENESLAGAANELILQGVVLCWGAFEVLARDCFIAHLNSGPARALALLEDSTAKRRFELSRISLDTLAAHGFNLSTRMGTLLAEQQDLSDIYSVKAIYQALFPSDKELRDSLNDPNLRLLSLRRNLIVHRRGIIDETYVASTNCSQPKSERLKLTPADLETHLQVVIETARGILIAVAS